MSEIKKYGRLTVIGEAARIGGRRAVKCLCDCGKLKVVTLKNLKRGNTRSCGCLQVEVNIARSTKHGFDKRSGRLPEYVSWQKMKRRCQNPSDPAFENYGGRGIKVCDVWLKSFPEFLKHVGKKPSPDHSIDRIDNNGDYTPGNVKWSTVKEQCNNRRSNHVLEMNGTRKNLTQWGSEVGINSLTLLRRLKLGWSVEKTLTTPLR